MGIRWLLPGIAILFIIAPTFAQELPNLPLAMRDISYRTERVGEGAYAVIPDLPVRNTSGFIIGERGVLVIDGIFNVDKTKKVIAEVRRITSKPILYVVNTNYNCDHVCGNGAFSDETTIIAQRKTRALMEDYEENRDFIKNVIPKSEADLLSESKAPKRLPDILFDDHLTVDLGGRVVEIWHFGGGNTPGDTIIYDPVSKTAWTGNFLLGKSMLTVWSGLGNPDEFADALSKMHRTLDIKTVVPGHGFSRVEGAELVTDQLFYVNAVITVVRRAIETGMTPEEMIAAHPIDTFPRPPGVEKWLNTLSRAHAANLRRAYELAKEAP